MFNSDEANSANANSINTNVQEGLEAEDSMPVYQVLNDEDEYRYLADMNDVLIIPEEMMDEFNEILQHYNDYMQRAHVDEKILDMDERLIRNSFYFAYKAHRHQKRKNGEPYINHPLATANILVELEVDAETLAAAFLHDTIEDTVADSAMVSSLFGPTITQLVEGVTKISKIQYSSKAEAQASNVRKLLMAVAEDIRVILIKLADRMHNMRTLKHQPPAKQVEIAQETLDLYVPFAERLGIFKMKWELEDLCLRYLDRDAYYELVGLVSSKRSEREAYINKVVDEIKAAIEANGTVKGYEVEGRPKHFYSIYKKMHDKGKTIDQIYDMFACRIIVEKLADCYTVLGIVNSTFTPIDGRCKDYIALPKENNYQSIHTTVRRDEEGDPFEVQIRTYAMHKTAEYGIAAHWHYKEAGNSGNFNTDKLDERMTWIRQFLETQRETENNATEFLDFLKTNISLDEVFVFTPNRDVIRLPVGACPIDFAYMIHSNVGNHMHGAKVNGRIVPLSYKLKNGDVVEILTSDKIKGPSKDWAKVVVTASARNRINAWFRKESRGDDIVNGREQLEREIQRNGFSVNQIINDKFVPPLLRKYSYAGIEDLYAAIGYGTLSALKIFGKLRDEYIRSLTPDERQKIGYYVNEADTVLYRPVELPDDIGRLRVDGEHVDNGMKELTGKGNAISESKPINGTLKSRKNGINIIVDGLTNCETHLSQCCFPAPGDEIIGYVRQVGGVGVHRTNCPTIISIMRNANKSEKDKERASRLVKVRWKNYTADDVVDYKIRIIASDGRFLLGEVISAINAEHIFVTKFDSTSKSDFTCEINVVMEIRNHNQFDRVIGRIKGIKDVIEVTRQ